jgi:DNA-binding CsgD family transcriptional regulator
VKGSRSGSAKARAAGPRGGKAAQRRRARERRFRTRVKRLRGCFGVLSARERRVLTLRAGLGDERPQSRRRVADELGVGRGEVRSTERRALRRLGAARRSGGCGGAGGTGEVGAGSTPGDAFLVAADGMPSLQPRVLLAGREFVDRTVLAEGGAERDDARDRDEGDVAGVEESNDDASGAPGSGDAPGGLSREVTVVAASGGGEPSRVLWMGLAALVTLLLLMLLSMRRGDRQAATAGGPAVDDWRARVVTATAAGAATARERDEREPTPETDAEPGSADHEAPPGDTAAASASSPDTAAAPISPGDPAAAPGPPAASAAAGAAAGATPRDDRTVVRRRSGGLVGAVKPAGEQAAKAAKAATQRLRGLAGKRRK